MRYLAIGDTSTIPEFWDFPTDTIRGTWCMPASGPTINPASFGAGQGVGYVSTFFGNTTGTNIISFPGNNLPGGGIGYYGWARYGYNDFQVGFATSDDTNDPSLALKQYLPDGLEFFEASARFALEDNSVYAGVTLGVEATNSPGFGVFANLRWNPSGNIDLDLYSGYGGFVGEEYEEFGSGLAVIDSSWSLGDYYWLKVEKRGYFWRARAWKDGDSEPSTWDCEGWQPMIAFQSGFTNMDWIHYPYDDNWVGNVNHDIAEWDPRGGYGLAAGGGLAYSGHLASFHYARRQQAKLEIRMADFDAHYTGDSTTPTDMGLRLESDDGLIDYGSTTIPWGAHRMVEASKAVHSSGQDEFGINVSMWKETGAPDWQTSGAGRIFRIAPFRRFVPQIYRRVFG